MQQDHAHEREECYIAVDIETSGPVPGVFNMLSLGACPVDAPDQKFYAELRPLTEHAIPEALHVSGFTLDQLARTGRAPRDPMTSFRASIQEVAPATTPVLLASH